MPKRTPPSKKKEKGKLDDLTICPKGEKEAELGGHLSTQRIEKWDVNVINTLSYLSTSRFSHE